MNKNNQPWDKNLQLLLAMIVGVNVLPHVYSVPLWVTASAFLAIAWKVLYLTRGLALPPKWLLWLAALMGTSATFFSYSTLFGQDAAGALLVVMAALKLLETNRYRDAMLVIFTSYFLLMSHLLDSQSLSSTVFLVIDVLLITSLMFQAHRRDRKGSPRAFKPALRLIALSVPLWIFLFFVFPRFSTGLWNVKTPEAGTGFSENLDPGSISKLIDSEETAFRVQFNFGGIPPQESLYWRGAILTVGDGLKWTKARSTPLAPDELVPDGQARRSIEYDVWLEPGFEKWLFMLDFPVSFASNDQQFLSIATRQPGFIYESSRPLFSRSAYTGRSVLEAPIQSMTDKRLRPFLLLPNNLSEQTRALAQKIAKTVEPSLPATESTPPARARVLARAVSKWFVDEGFRYTKTPGALSSIEGTEQLDEFLFQTRRGFCEHYAAAFATLMRAMGIPARVVVGFQGGNVNDLGGYWIVRKLDAHAWAEVWAQEPGDVNRGRWIRVDPTELIAPLRLQLGGEFYRVDSNALAGGITSEELRRRLSSGLTGLLRRVQFGWDVIQMRWNAFLLRYDFDYQAELLKAFGFQGRTMVAMSIILAVGVLLFGTLIAWSLRRRAHKADPLLKDWQIFCQRLEKVGLRRSLNEGPLDFAARAASAQPGLAAEIHAIAKLFADLRYGSGPSGSAKKEFHQSVRRFSISSNSRKALS